MRDMATPNLFVSTQQWAVTETSAQLETMPTINPDEYKLAIKKRGTAARPWRWEIYAPCKSTPVQASEFFQTMSEATRAGKVALSKLRNAA